MFPLYSLFLWIPGFKYFSVDDFLSDNPKADNYICKSLNLEETPYDKVVLIS